MFLLRKVEKSIPATTRFKSDLIQELALVQSSLLKRREKLTKIEDNTTQVLPKLDQAKEGGPYGGMLLLVLLRCLYAERVRE